MLIETGDPYICFNETPIPSIYMFIYYYIIFFFFFLIEIASGTLAQSLGGDVSSVHRLIGSTPPLLIHFRPAHPLLISSCNTDGVDQSIDIDKSTFFQLSQLLSS